MWGPESLTAGCCALLPHRRVLERQRAHLICLGRLPYNPDVPQHFELWQAVCSAYASEQCT